MKLSYEYGTQKIEFTVAYRNRKTLLIEVEAPKNITVIAPEGTTGDKILEAVKSKSKWIVQKLFEIKEMEYRKRSRQYVNGESFIYMGRNYSLAYMNHSKEFWQLLKRVLPDYESRKAWLRNNGINAPIVIFPFKYSGSRAFTINVPVSVN